MPAEQQVEAVSKKLVELNPGFDGKVTPTIKNGVVTGLQFLTINVTDISPVRALTGLKSLIGTGFGVEKAKVSNLSPLEGMRLTTLHCFNNNVSELSALKGMPLVTLLCYHNSISDLSPLKN